MSESEPVKPVKPGTLKEVVSWISVVLVGVLAALFIGNVVIVNANVPSGSMMDTIAEKSRIVAFRLSYLFSEPERLDVVVFKFPDNEKELYVKRIIGLPGDTVDIKDGLVYINGALEPLEDAYVSGENFYDFTDGPFIVPEDSYFMLGDNRASSVDSPDWVNTYVNRKKILGKVIFSYFPEVKAIK